jgi:AhpC/TSA family
MILERGDAFHPAGVESEMVSWEHWGSQSKGERDMSLKKQLAQFDASRNRPPEITAILKRGVEAVRGPGTAGLPIGETAPDFTLPNQRGDAVRLADRLSRGPVVLSFYRGVW